jgi:catechol 2,3-dioxygenase-like lactoylglutathione lyase family enzyme
MPRLLIGDSRADCAAYLFSQEPPIGAAFLCSFPKYHVQEKRMGILESARPTVIVCTRDRTRATNFYRDTLGLTLAYEDELAAVFNLGCITLRVSEVRDFRAHEHTILGFNVLDVEAAVKALREKGVTFNIYPGFNQNELGILIVPGRAVQVAWLKDPDGNVLSVTNG